MKKSIVLILLTCVLTVFVGCGGGEESVEDIYNRELKESQILGTWITERCDKKVTIYDNGTMTREQLNQNNSDPLTVYWEIIDDKDAEHNFKFKYDFSEDIYNTDVYVSKDGTTMSLRDTWDTNNFEVWFKEDSDAEKGRKVINIDVADLYIVDNTIVAELEVTNKGECSYGAIRLGLEYRDENDKTLFVENRSIYEDELLKPGQTENIKLKVSTEFANSLIKNGKSTDDIELLRLYVDGYLKY